MVLPDSYYVYTSDEVDQIKKGLPMALFHWDEKKWLIGYFDGEIKDSNHYKASVLVLKTVGGFFVHFGTFCDDSSNKRKKWNGRQHLNDYEAYFPTIEDMIKILQIMVKGLQLKEE